MRQVMTQSTLLLAVSVALMLGFSGLAFAKYEVVDVGNGGSIKGVATWKGDIPKLPPIKVFKHMDICGETVPSPVLQVDPTTKGVRFVMAYLEAVDKGKAPEKKYWLHMGKTDNRSESILCNFEEHVFPFVRTKKVAMINFDRVLHNPHGFTNKGSTLFNIALPDPFREITSKFRRARGVGMVVQCDAHVHMNAWMASFEHPYFATTDKKGKFEITDIPPGTYTLVAWHEGYNIVEFGSDSRPVYDDPHTTKQEIEIKAGETTVVNFEFPVRDVTVDWKIAGK